MRGKTRSRRKLKGAFTRTAVAFGDLATMDHIHMRGSFGRAGLGGVLMHSPYMTWPLVFGFVIQLTART